MSEDKTTQAATAEANTEAKPSVEGSGAPEGKKDDLDALLAEYQRETGSTGQTQTTTAPAKPAAPADVVPRSEFDALKAVIEQERLDKEMTQLVSGIRAAAGDALPDILDDDAIIGIVDQRARKEPALRKAWAETAGNPAARARLIQKVGEDMGRRYANAKANRIDENATADKEAVAAVVRGASTKAPEGKAPDFSKMNDSEFRKSVKEKYGFNPF